MSAGIAKTLETGTRVAFFAAIAGAGLAALALAVRDYAHARESRAWETVEGVVLSAPDRKMLRYAYVAGGKTHESRRATFVTGALASPELDRAPGETIEVLVDPENPAMSVIVPGGSSFVFALVTTTAAFLIFVGVGGLVRTAVGAAPFNRR